MYGLLVQPVSKFPIVIKCTPNFGRKLDTGII